MRFFIILSVTSYIELDYAVHLCRNLRTFQSLAQVFWHGYKLPHMLCQKVSTPLTIQSLLYFSAHLLLQYSLLKEKTKKVYFLPVLPLIQPAYGQFRSLQKMCQM